MYGVVEKFMEDFYRRELGMNVQLGNRKKGMRGLWGNRIEE